MVGAAAPGRTGNPQVRSLILYPIELRLHLNKSEQSNESLSLKQVLNSNYRYDFENHIHLT